MYVAEDAGIRRKLPKLRTMPFVASNGHLYEYATTQASGNGFGGNTSELPLSPEAILGMPEE